MAELKHNHHVSRVLEKIGLVNTVKIADTLQGSIWRASQHGNKSRKQESAVIKITNISLHQHSMAIIDNKSYRIHENILLEQSILKYLTEHENCPKSIVKFHRFFRTNTDYFLQMEDGGSSLFQFIRNAHKLMLDEKIEINNWQKVIQIIFKQMIECIAYIHSKNVCHFDISLENFLINDVQVEVEESLKRQKMRILTDDIQIKLCDFGLAELFTNHKCLSSKHCGKKHYKSPEVINKQKRFEAKKNDIWSVGVCLFMMITGNAPWNIANKTDKTFVLMTNGYMMDILKRWGVLRFVDANLIHLFESIFQFESNRISLKQIINHKWLK